MVVEPKPRARKGKKTKATGAGASSGGQRSLKDMFAGPSKSTDGFTLEGVRIPVIELTDSEPDTNTLPSTQETTEINEISDTDSLRSAEDGVDLSESVPKELSSMSRSKGYSVRQKSETVLHESDRNVINISDEDSCTEETTPYARRLGKHLFSQSSSNTTGTPKGKHTTSITLSRHGSSHNMPILVDTSPVKLRVIKPTAAPAKPMWSIFAPRQRDKQSILPGGLRTVVTPYPEKDTQHIRGPQTERASIHSSPFVRHRTQARVTEPFEEFASLSKLCHDAAAFRKQTLRPQAQDIDLHSYIGTIPSQDRNIPAISRLLQFAESVSEDENVAGTNHERWADRWRPKRADEVVGNEQHALYLRDWLVALRVQSDTVDSPSSSQSSATNQGKKRKLARRKRPQVVRHVKKRRGNTFEDFMPDFIAPDDMTDSEDDAVTAASSDFDDIAFCQEMDARVNGGSTDVSRGSSPPTGPPDDEASTHSFSRRRRLGQRLKNTLLLAGPSGVGKTAAVYACAEELGWEVFEVYPGIGERNGASLNRLVGDVGRNHMVTTSRSKTLDTPKTKPPRKSARAQLRIADSSDVESTADELDIIEPFPPVHANVTEPPQAAVNQSLILVEEVDILYQTDSNFWPALVNIIKECRRPVVLTCNDMSLVPCRDLPLQDTLHFQHCPSPLATSYLQALCLAEGQKYPRQELTRIYDTSDNSSYLSQDLRHTINQLQVLSNQIPPTFTPASLARPSSLADLQSDCIFPPTSSPLTSLVSGSSPPPLQLPDSRTINADELSTLRNMIRSQDHRSFTDAYLSRETNGSLWSLSQSGPAPSANDEMGHSVLYSERDLDNVPISSYFYQDQALFDEILQLSRDASPDADGKFSMGQQTDVLDEDRTPYLSTAGSVLRTLSSAHVCVSDPALHLDYAPWVRYILMAEDDVNATISLSQPLNQGRMTRNSQRTATWRWLRLSEEERKILVGTRLSAGVS